MPFKIQRVPRGLNDLLAVLGGATPIELEDRIRGVLDLLQMYGTTQLQSGVVNNAALAEGAFVQLTPSPSRWTILFAAHCSVVKTATMTALRASVRLQRNTINTHALFSAELGPFGATETGTCSVGGFLPYPLICPPGTIVSGVCEVIGTDANANVNIVAEFGVL